MVNVNKILEGQKIKDPTNPSYYKDGITSIECIEAMELMFDFYDVQQFCLCNAFKYIWRHKHKNGLEDLDKAQWYISHAIKLYADNDINDKDLWTDSIDKLQKLLNAKRKQWQESH